VLSRLLLLLRLLLLPLPLLLLAGRQYGCQLLPGCCLLLLAQGRGRLRHRLRRPRPLGGAA
jgi:hypothetical protein